MSVSDRELSVLIIDDVDLVAETIATVLNAALGYRVDVVNCVAAAVDKIERDGPYSAVLLDFNMPGTDPSEALRQLNRCNGGRTAIFSGVSDPEVATTARQSGAVAFIPKDTPIATLGTIIADIAAGRATPLPVAPRPQRDMPVASEAALKVRERQMLALLADGVDLAAIGAALGVGPVIVTIDVRSVCQKLASSNIDEAVQKARTLGLI